MMRRPFNPLAFVFAPFPVFDESPAAVAYHAADRFRAEMREKARGISAEASARLREQWPRLLDAVLLEETSRMCAALRGGFTGYSLN